MTWSPTLVCTRFSGSTFFICVQGFSVITAHLFPHHMRGTAGYIWTDYKTNAQIAKQLKITPILDKLLEFKRNWIQHVNRMPLNRLPRLMKRYSPTGRRNHGRPLKRLLDTWDRNGSTSGPTPWHMMMMMTILKMCGNNYLAAPLYSFNWRCSFFHVASFKNIVWYLMVVIIYGNDTCVHSPVKWMHVRSRYTKHEALTIF